MKGARWRRCHAGAALIASNGFITAGGKKKKGRVRLLHECDDKQTQAHKYIDAQKQEAGRRRRSLGLAEGEELPAAVRWWSSGPRPSSPATAPTLSSSAGSETPPPGCAPGTCAASRRGPPTWFCAVAPRWSEGFVLGPQGKPGSTIAAMLVEDRGREI